MFKQKKGITLIALVVTIIVLLILAAVSINAVMGDNGIATKAKKSQEQTVISQEKEYIGLAYNAALLNKTDYSNITKSDLQIELNNLGQNTEVNQYGKEFIVTYLETRHKYSLNQNGNIDKTTNLSSEEADKIIEVGELYNGVYLLSAGGTVRYIDNITATSLTELDIQNSQIITENGIRQIGYDFFVDGKGKVYTWDDNHEGKLGIGSDAYFVDGMHCVNDVEGSILDGKNIVEVYSPYNTMYAIDDEGNLYGWGYNRNGQLANGTFVNSNMPMCITDVEGSSLQGKKIKEMIAGPFSSIVLSKDGKVYTWGDNVYGEAGSGSLDVRRYNLPTCVNDVEGSALNGIKVEKLCSGSYLTKVLDENGKLYGWGGNYNYQLGNGNKTNYPLAICINDVEGSVLSGKTIEQVVTSENLTIVRDSEGLIYTWGSNTSGLGNGTSTYSAVPVCISNIDGSALQGKKVVEIFNDDYADSTTFVKDEDGKLYGWGYNAYGQLGNNTTTLSSLPICISDIENSALSGIEIDTLIGSDSILAKDTNNKWYAWGYNEDLQLGVSEYSNNVLMPVCLTNMTNNALYNKNLTEIYYGYAKDSESNIYFWGDVTDETFGLSGVVDSAMPFAITQEESCILYNKKIKQVYPYECNYHYGYMYITEDGKIYYNAYFVEPS